MQKINYFKKRLKERKKPKKQNDFAKSKKMKKDSNKNCYRIKKLN